jgi:hypothetical protein
VARHLEPPTPIGVEPVRERAGVGRVGPHEVEPRQRAPFSRGAEQHLSPGAVRDVGRVHVGQQDQAERVDQDVPLAALHPLGAIVPSGRPADPGRPGRLAVQDRGARLGVPALGEADPLAQAVVRGAQRAGEPPAPELGVDGRPRRVVARQEPPGAARPEQVEDGVGDEPPRPLRRPPAVVAPLQQGREERPFRVGQVREVAASGLGHGGGPGDRGSPGGTRTTRPCAPSSNSKTVSSTTWAEPAAR